MTKSLDMLQRLAYELHWCQSSFWRCIVSFPLFFIRKFGIKSTKPPKDSSLIMVLASFGILLSGWPSRPSSILADFPTWAMGTFDKLIVSWSLFWKISILCTWLESSNAIITDVLRIRSFYYLLYMKCFVLRWSSWLYSLVFRHVMMWRWALIFSPNAKFTLRFERSDSGFYSVWMRSPKFRMHSMVSFSGKSSQSYRLCHGKNPPLSFPYHHPLNMHIISE